MIGETTIKTIDHYLELDLKEELRAQGHFLTGALERSIKSKQTTSGGKSVIDIEALEYADDLLEGVAPEHIDQADIAGLTIYAQKRFVLSGKAAVKAAVAIARKHAQEGNPTQNSYNYSATGERLFANVEAYNKNEAEYSRFLETGVSAEIDQFINKTFDQTFF
jgi:hypothetical protein